MTSISYCWWYSWGHYRRFCSIILCNETECVWIVIEIRLPFIQIVCARQRWLRILMTRMHVQKYEQKKIKNVVRIRWIEFHHCLNLHYSCDLLFFFNFVSWHHFGNKIETNGTNQTKEAIGTSETNGTNGKNNTSADVVFSYYVSVFVNVFWTWARITWLIS